MNTLSLRDRRPIFIFFALILAVCASAHFKIQTEAQTRETADIFQRLQFRSIGPAIMGGRIDDFAVVENNPQIIYAATASGGLWKTINNGTTWESLFDNESHSSIGDVTIAPSNPEIVWVGTGEANNRQSSSWGNGVYKSTDGGKSWMNMGLRDTHHIGRMAIHPKNPNIVYVATLGHLWGANKERGLFKTSDGGKTWVNTNFINEDTGFVDLAMDPLDPNILYAAAYQRRRTPFGFNGGGPHSGLYKTSDGGTTWTKLTVGLPSGPAGRIGIDIYRKDPQIVYITYEHATESGTYRSDDRGASWKKMSSTNPRPMYYSKIRIDPNNDQRIYLLGAFWYQSDNGGANFTTISGQSMRIHGDFHALWIDPNNSNHLIAGSDGGITFSYDKGRTWDYVNDLPLGQFYEIGFDFRNPYWIYGGLQDNGSWGGPVRTLNTLGLTNDEWIRVGGGDGFYAQVDPKDPQTLYVESQNGNIQRLNLASGESKNIKPRPDEDSTDSYRFDWNSPILISPHNNRKIFLGGNRLFISSNRGDIWEKVSPDLTKAIDRRKLAIMGVVPTPNVLSGHDGQENYSQITSISESPVKAGVIWVGTDDGNVQVSRDGGEKWKNVIDRIPGVPVNPYVTRIIASQAAAGRAYVAFDGHRNDDFKPYLFVTEDFGETWKPIMANLQHPANVIREHPRNHELLFVGTEFGLYISLNRGGSWMQLKNNLPTVPVDDIAIHPRDNDLILGTHGRSIWVLDDMGPIEQLNRTIMASTAHLFDIRPATMWRIYNHKGNTGHKTFTASNPPNGALINYYLRERARERPTISILDRNGNLVRQFLGSSEPGIQRVQWDLRYQPPSQSGMQPNAAGGGGGGGRGSGGLTGPRVLAGKYVVRLSANGREMTKQVVVEEDPRIRISPADAEARLKILLAINKLQRSGLDAQRLLDNLRTQLTSVQDSLKKQANQSEQINTEVTLLLQEVVGLRRGLSPQFRGPSQEDAGPTDQTAANAVLTRINRLYSEIDSVTEAATTRHHEQLKKLTALLNGQIERINVVITQSVPNLNKRIAESGMTPIKAGEMIAPLQ